MLPKRFCWTRFGTESGEDISSILARKERERLATGGIFLWGIGNSVGPAMRDLIRLERQPIVAFSPMRSKPKAVDVAPSGVLRWTEALDLDGNDWPIPEAIQVTSRRGDEGGRAKLSHYALVCRAKTSLAMGNELSLQYDQLVNLQSGNKLGASQVTAVVEQLSQEAPDSAIYPVAFSAELVYPYFVKLVNPIDPVSPRTRQAHQGHHAQASLLAA